MSSTGAKLPKFEWRRKEDWIKPIFVISGSLLILGAFTVGGIAYTSRPSFCSSCHEMKPEFRTWQASPHNKISCVSCHVEPGISSLIKDKLGASVQVYKHLTGTAESTIVFPWGKKDISNETCLKCHSDKRESSPERELIVPHDKHLAKGISCVECHRGVAHGTIAERGVSNAEAIPHDQWTLDKGAKEMAREFSKPKMSNCIKCHSAESKTIVSAKQD